MRDSRVPSPLLRACAAVVLVPVLAASALPGGTRPGPGALAGRYVLRVSVGSSVRAPILGWKKSVATTTLLVEVREEAGRLVQRQRVCRVDIEGGGRAEIPEAFVRGIEPREYEPVVGPPGPGRSYYADLGIEAIGYDPGVTGGPLPRDRHDPGVVDNDRDGHPGATVVMRVPVLGGVRLYIAQRSHIVLRGAQTPSGGFEGSVEVRALEQKTLGASNPLLNQTLAIRPDPATSRFTMHPTDARACAEVGPPPA